MLSGFLGSGKTTLLRRYLAAADPAARIAVVINEFGETSIDHRLVRSSGDAPRVLASGCACCTVADQLRETLLELLREDAREGSQPIERIVLETSGLADPATILNTLRSDLVLAEYLEVGRCVVAFDALDGTPCAGRYAEVRHQLAAADTIVVTKADIADASSVASAIAHARSVNALAHFVTAASADFAIGSLFDKAGATRDLSPSLPFHAGSIKSFCLSLHGTVDWASFSVWLTCLLHRHGSRILRFKAVLDVASTQGPLVVHGVRHLVYPPQHLMDATAVRGQSDLVFILDGIDARQIEASLQAFLAFALHQSQAAGDARTRSRADSMKVASTRLDSPSMTG